MAKVSVIVPTYNHSAYIADCLVSVLRQTVDDWEMIVIDDGSTDGTAAVVSTFDDSRIRYHRRAHSGIGGLGDLYNAALQQSSAEFIAILEGDDFWPSDRLALLLDAIRDPLVVVSYGITQLVDDGGQPLDCTIPSSSHLQRYSQAFANQPNSFAVSEMLKCNALWTGAVASLIRRRALQTIGGFQAVPGGALVDRPTFFSLGLIGDFAFVPQITGFWRQHRASGTHGRQTWALIATGLASYIDEFLHSNRDRLMISHKEAAEIRRYWKNASTSAKLASGRSCLLNGDYARARREFVSCVASTQARYALPASLGYLASLLRCDIEWIYQALGADRLES